MATERKERETETLTEELQCMDLTQILTQTTVNCQKKKRMTNEGHPGSMNTDWVFENIKGLFLIFLGVVLPL